MSLPLFGESPADLREMLLSSYVRPLAKLAMDAGAVTVSVVVTRAPYAVRLLRSPTHTPRWSAPEQEDAWLHLAHLRRFGPEALDPASLREAFAAVRGDGPIHFAVVRAAGKLLELEALPLDLGPEAPRRPLLPLPGVATVGEGLRNLERRQALVREARLILAVLSDAQRNGAWITHRLPQLQAALDEEP